MSHGLFDSIVLFETRISHLSGAVFGVKSPWSQHVGTLGLFKPSPHCPQSSDLVCLGSPLCTLSFSEFVLPSSPRLPSPHRRLLDSARIFFTP